MKLLIECFNSNSISKQNFYLEIFNNSNKKIFSNYICNNYVLESKINEVYKIKVTNEYYTIINSVIIGQCKKLKYVFNRYKYRLNFVELKYDNLPIERGNIIICQEHTA